MKRANGSVRGDEGGSYFHCYSENSRSTSHQDFSNLRQIEAHITDDCILHVVFKLRRFLIATFTDLWPGQETKGRILPPLLIICGVLNCLKVPRSQMVHFLEWVSALIWWGWFCQDLHQRRICLSDFLCDICLRLWDIVALSKTVPPRISWRAE